MLTYDYGAPPAMIEVRVWAARWGNALGLLPFVASNRCEWRMTVPEILEKRGPFREEHLAMAKEQASTKTLQNMFWLEADRCCSHRADNPRQRVSGEGRESQPPVSPPSC
jgi:hypothetical protein